MSSTIRYLLVERTAGLGLMIMLLCGFAAYMTHIGANQMLVRLLSKPVAYVRSPYLLMVVAILSPVPCRWPSARRWVWVSC